MEASNQLQLFGLDSKIKELFSLYDNNKLPNKIILSGLKGIGKCTMAYHFINYVLSLDEEHAYDKDNFKIDTNNKSYKLINNYISPNFYLLDVLQDKKNIDINQVRSLINNLNKSSFNRKPRFVLIDNIEFLNVNSINALLKVLEEPNQDVHFILINNNSKVLPTLKSRCLDFKIFLSNNQVIEITSKLLNFKIADFIHESLINYYCTPGKIYNLVIFCEKNKIDIKDTDLKFFLKKLIKDYLYKKSNFIKLMMYELIEFYLVSKISFKKSDLYSFFIQKIYQTKKFNLDEETLLIEFESKVLNG